MSERTLRWVAIVLLSVLLVGGTFLLWISLQPYSAVSQLADSLAADGSLESFTLSRYTKIHFGFLDFCS